jgi:hypothetical protein
MNYSWIPKLFVPVATGLVFAAFRKYFPAKRDPTLERYDRPGSKRMPAGAFSAITISMGLTIVIGGFFSLRAINHQFAKIDGIALLHVFPVSAIWFFLPGFAALAVPWPLTIALLRRSAYKDDAAYIEAEGSNKSGFDCFRVMVSLNLFLVLPIAFFSVLALPERLTFTEHGILWTHYASLKPEIFKYSEIVRLTKVDGYLLRDGSFNSHKDVLIDFKDGHRLSANAVGDGGSEPSAEEISILLDKTGLVLREVRTKEEIQ